MEAYYLVQELGYMYSYPEAFKAALDLNIPDILHAAGEAEPLTPHQIADRLPRKSHDAPELLHRILRLLAHHGIFSQTPASDSLSTRYGLNTVSKYLVTGAEFDLKPHVRLMQRRELVDSLGHLRETVEEGKSGFVLATGMEVWRYASEKPEFNEVFNAAMRSRSKVLSSVVARGYEGFRDVQCLVDVGGGVGGAVTQIVSAHPHIRGINFDLPHVVATAPHIPGVEHVRGSFLEFVPPADAMLLQQVLHDWGDEDCIRILKNCHKALPPNGKLLIRDQVIDPSRNSATKTNAAFNSDVLMMATFQGNGKERTTAEWKSLLEAAGFSHISFLSCQGLDLIESIKT
jgi:hypothetical protein